jgi:hypothetical protein
MRALLLLVGACGFHATSEVIGGDANPALDAHVQSTQDAGLTLDAGVSTALDATIAIQLDCPSSANWITVGAAHYFVSPDGDDKTWWDAEADCEAMTMGHSQIHLAVFASDAEALALAPHLVAPSSWTGMFQPLDQALPIAGWEWITGGNGIVDWSPGEPNDGNSAGGGEDNKENFAAIYQTGLQNDADGNAVFHYVCRCDGLPISTTAEAKVPPPD